MRSTNTGSWRCFVTWCDEREDAGERRRAAVMSWGCTGDRGRGPVVQSCTSGRLSKVDQVDNRRLQDVNSEHFVSGAGCGDFVHVCT